MEEWLYLREKKHNSNSFNIKENDSLLKMCFGLS